MQENNCPACGHFQSYRKMVDGKPMRQCSACGHIWAKGTKSKSSSKSKKEETETTEENKE